MIAGCYTRRFCGMSTAPGPPEASPALSLQALRRFLIVLPAGCRSSLQSRSRSFRFWPDGERGLRDLIVGDLLPAREIRPQSPSRSRGRLFPFERVLETANGVLNLTLDFVSVAFGKAEDQRSGVGQGNQLAAIPQPYWLGAAF